jgi:KipI family sensor histidine kinase inhibitor
VRRGEHGPDLDQVARHCGLTPTEVIERHSAVTYPIYMIGFSPGFPFLGGLDPKLHTPRLATPRTRVPAGSVGIANAQTGIYPVESPGGWQLIGRTPLTLFLPDHRTPFRYQVGDQLRFIPIEQEEYDQIHAKESA